MALLTEPSQPGLNSAQQQQQHHQQPLPPPGLSLNVSNLNSNNPFRKNSPSLLSPAIPSPRTNSPRSATNPFLAPAEQQGESLLQSQTAASLYRMEVPQASSRPAPNSDAAQLFDRLTLLEKGQAPNGGQPNQPRSGLVPNGGHRVTRSGEDGRPVPRSRGPQPRRNGPAEELDIFASPEKQREARLVRRNSESSYQEKSSLTEAERKRRQMKHRERAARSRESRASNSSRTREGDRDKKTDSKDPKDPSKPRRKPRGMDLIDQLDQTGIYGSGFIHHDGPFDAVNPHRNRKRDARAPMQAFPANSANNTIGGSGPVNKNIDLERFHGVGAEGFSDYSNTFKRPGAERAMSFDPTARVEPVHGEQSLGLGTSTFLEGAPASKAAMMQRRQSETQEPGAAGGLGRKKSLAQRIRGMSRPERPSGAIRSPAARYAEQPYGATETSPTSPGGPPIRMAQSAGGPSRAMHKQSETNPFDTLYDAQYEKKGASGRVTETSVPEASVPENSYSGHTRAPSSPRRNQLQRSQTNTDNGTEEPKPAGGFLNRVKSLKGGRRRRES
ncbi:Pal1-domain-containing protein [Tothia fuscella]|uniref:Pal1-domain-containing protein n=1 Tax=Tothia fuscella TaxID=1048955 RepID=A0A9P4NUJ9_9PEZI|nr:Pal1-domain-containing protein [Tothia fuscella]